jgi:hypothetical protein
MSRYPLSRYTRELQSGSLLDDDDLAVAGVAAPFVALVGVRSSVAASHASVTLVPVTAPTVMLLPGVGAIPSAAASVSAAISTLLEAISLAQARLVRLRPPLNEPPPPAGWL